MPVRLRRQRREGRHSADCPPARVARQGAHEVRGGAHAGASSVPDVAAFLHLEAPHFIKTMIVETDREFAVALVRGDDEINEVKLKNVLDAAHLQLAAESKVEQVTGGGWGSPVRSVCRAFASWPTRR